MYLAFAEGHGHVVECLRDPESLRDPRGNEEGIDGAGLLALGFAHEKIIPGAITACDAQRLRDLLTPITFNMSDPVVSPSSGNVGVGQTRSILFVCMGNICRSPLGKAVFQLMTIQRGVEYKFMVDSCGTGGWHVGEGADPRTLAVAKKYNVPITHRARQLSPLYDAAKFDLILAMDRRNIHDMQQMGLGIADGKVRRLREFDPASLAAFHPHGEDALDVPDPYYGGADGFDLMYHMIRAACDGLLTHLLNPKTDRT